MVNNDHYNRINNQIEKSSNILKIRYAELLKKYPYFAVENNLTLVDGNGIEYSSIIFLSNKNDVVLNDNKSFFQLVKGASSYKLSDLAASKKDEIPNGIYETKYIDMPETKSYSYDDLNSLKEISDSPDNDFSLIFEAVENILTFDEYDSIGLKNKDENISYQTVYSNIIDSGKFGYVVHRVLFKNEIVGYLTCQERYLEVKDFFVFNSKSFSSMIEYMENNFSGREIDSSPDNEIVDLFSDEFLFYFDQKNNSIIKK